MHPGTYHIVVEQRPGGESIVLKVVLYAPHDTGIVATFGVILMVSQPSGPCGAAADQERITRKVAAMNDDRSPLTIDFGNITLEDVPLVGGKNASLGELFNRLHPRGIGVLDGYAVTSVAWRSFLREKGLGDRLVSLLSTLDPADAGELARCGAEARRLVLETPLPENIRSAVVDAHRRLVDRLGTSTAVAVRSSATAEDLPGASFAGQQETYLNVLGEDALLDAVHHCFASLYTDRAISYRTEMGFDHSRVALSVGVMPMVNADRGSSGVIFTLDPESGFRDLIVISGSWGLGEAVVQGSVTPDEWRVFRPTLAAGFEPIIVRTRGAKEFRLVRNRAGTGIERESTSSEEQNRFCLDDRDVLTLAAWAVEIEEHYSGRVGHAQPMDIEWVKDGETGELFIIQARPETVHSAPRPTEGIEVFTLTAPTGPPIVTGQAVGDRIASGRVRVVRSAAELASVRSGDVVVAELTDPDWEPAMRRMAALVTNRGGRTAHAAIVSRELGLPCVVGAGNATELLHDGDEVTVSCAEGTVGRVYAGLLDFEVERIDPESVGSTRTAVMMNVADPEGALRLASIRNDGVGLARIEFVVAHHIGIHPMALVRYPDIPDAGEREEITRRLAGEDPQEYFVRRLCEGVAQIAAPFYPKPVIVRTSDFKTNEYARLLGGSSFEPEEENPMLGFRGASRYYDPLYADGFALECRALARLRDRMGLTNVKVMIPFCRTVEEGRKVIEVMGRNSLRQGENGLEIYAMCELPSNALDADAFLTVFDGFSIGSNDLTQLTLGIDRDSAAVAHLFDERDDAVRRLISMAIDAAHRARKPIGICGQAPSDFPDFAEWLVEQGISSISLNPDTVLRTTARIAACEERLDGTR